MKWLILFLISFTASAQFNPPNQVGELGEANKVKFTYKTPQGGSVDLGGITSLLNTVMNFLPDGYVEGNTLEWNAYDDGATSVPIDGTGGSTDITCTANLTTPLNGVSDLKLAKDASNRQGEGCSLDFTIPSGYQGHKVPLQFLYNLSDGNFTGDDVGVYLYDVTNAALVDLPTNSLYDMSTMYHEDIEFPSNSTSYRLILHIRTTSVPAYDLFFDDLKITPFFTPEKEVVNYATNWNFEKSVNKWSCYDDGASEPVDGTGGTCTQLSFVRNSTTPLMGSGDLALTVTGAAGSDHEGLSTDFTIDNGAQAKKLYISFKKDGSDADFLDDHLKLYVYDVTNTKFLPVYGEDVKGGDADHLAYFQSSPDSTSYRLLIHSTQTADSYTFNFDNVVIQERSQAIGMAGRDWTAYTPGTNGLGTVSDVEFWWRRVGDTMEIRGRLVVGTPTGDTMEVDLPTGNLIDVNKIDDNNTHQGVWFRGASSSNKGGAIIVDDASPGVLLFGSSSTFNSTSLNPLSQVTGSSSVSAGNSISVKASVPIAGWSANAVMSEDLNNRDVSLLVTGSGAQSITASDAVIDFLTLEKDTANGWNASTNEYTIQETGEYGVSLTTGGGSTGVNYTIKIKVNGVETRSAQTDLSANNKTFRPVVSNLDLEKGDVITATVVGSSASGVIYSGGAFTYMTISKKSQPQSIFTGETVAMRYTSDSGQSTTAGVLEFEDVDYDNFGIYNTGTGVATIPKKGYYDVKCSYRIDMNASGDTNGMVTELRVNGTSLKTNNNRTKTTANTVYQLHAYDAFYLEKSDEVECYGASSVTSTMSTNTADNSFTIIRLGD